jgi:hypothetical protein
MQSRSGRSTTAACRSHPSLLAISCTWTAPVCCGGLSTAKRILLTQRFLTSLTGTDGLAELGEALEEVEPGQMSRFLPYGLLG